MASDPLLARIENENGLIFGLKWSLIGCAMALCFLAGCSSLFDTGVPRYNTVQGPKRVPILNPGGTSAGMSEQMSQMPQPASVMAAPAYPTPAPYVAASQAGLEQEAANAFAQHSQPPVMPMTQPQTAPHYYDFSQQPVAGAPMLPANTQPVAMPNTAGIQAEIDALERELAMSQGTRNDLWQQQAAEGYAVPGNLQSQPVQLPGPPLPPAGMAGSSMPPVINQPYHDPMAGMPVRPETMGSIDVPLAPIVQRTPGANVPSSLIPPSERLYEEEGYLRDSRYSGRRQGVATQPY